MVPGFCDKHWKGATYVEFRSFFWVLPGELGLSGIF